MLRVDAGQAGLAEGGGEVIEAALRHALDHRADRRMIQRLEQLAVDLVRLHFVRDDLEQRAQALARIDDHFELAEDRFLFDGFPAFERGGQQRIARGEVPVETAFGHAEPACERLHRDGGDTLLCDEVECGLCPIFGTQARVAFGLGGGFVHDHIVTIRIGSEKYRLVISCRVTVRRTDRFRPLTFRNRDIHTSAYGLNVVRTGMPVPEAASRGRRHFDPIPSSHAEPA